MSISDEQLLFCSKDERSIKHFWSLVRKTDTCWLWEGKNINHAGYGIFAPYAKHTLRVHRFSYVLHNGKLPVEVVRHTCDNRLCVNPAHLLEGTIKDNIKDMDERGRRRAKMDYDKCLHGHVYAETGFYINSVNGHKMCKACILKSNRRRGQ